jgi:hypothetical protein
MEISKTIWEIFNTWYGNLIAILSVVGGLWALWDKTGGRLFMLLNLWPSMENWEAICLPWQQGEPNQGSNLLDPSRPLHHPGLRWCQMRNMRKDDYYQVDMQKDRAIVRFCLVCREGRYPKKYRIEVANNANIDSFEDLGEYSSPIDLRLPKPKKVRVVKFTITEPNILPDNAPLSWCVYEVRFTEVRLFSRWLKWTIKARSRT